LAGIDTIWFNPKKKNSGEIQPTYEIERLQQLLPLLQH
ncbi:MAG: HAD family hydrolase, partial [Enterococcus casseliflavus]